MKNKLSILKTGSLATCLALSLACGATNHNSGNAGNVSAGNTGTAPTGTANDSAVKAENKRAPKIVCDYLVKFTPGEYKNSSGSDYKCIATYPATTASGRPQNYSYTATGNAEAIEKVSVSMLGNSKHPDAAEAEDVLVESANELWQKAFAAPLPDEIKAAMQTDKGKQKDGMKVFPQQHDARVYRSPMGGTTYNLSFEFKLPK